MSKITKESAYRALEELSSDLPLHSSLQQVHLRFGHTLAALCCGFFFVALCLALVFLPWVQTVSGAGQVIAFSPDERRQNIEAPVDGKIDEWFVFEGSQVQEGQKIAELEDLDPLFVERIEKELQAALANVASAKLAIRAADSNRQRQSLLASKGLSSVRDKELAEIEYQRLQAELAIAQAEVARVETKQSRQTAQIITAPRSGIIQRIIAPQGRVFVHAGDPLAVLVPESSQLIAELTLSGNDLPLIQEGRHVRLQFDGWPAVQLPGWPSVAVGTFGGRVKVVDPSDDGTGRFRIIVEQDREDSWPSHAYLRQGVRVIGWVLLDEVSLGWELWRRFNGFPLQVIPPDHLGNTTRTADTP